MGILVLSRARRKVVQGGERARDGSTAPGACWRRLDAEWWPGARGEGGEQMGRGADGPHDPEQDPDGTVPIGGRADVMRC